MTVIRNLSACDASLSQEFPEHLIAAAWSRFPTNEIRSMLMNGISLYATGHFDLKGRISFEAVASYIPYISEYVSYE